MDGSNKANLLLHRIFTIDVEDWFHILDSPAVPLISEWDRLESRLERNLRVLLDLLGRCHVKATLFWLGWAAERFPALLKECRATGHEIGSHGYAHILAFQAGEAAFREDTAKAKSIIEGILGERIDGYRTPGFGITEATPWAFEIIRELGHTYDSSVFPAARGHGGQARAAIGSYEIQTAHGPLHEVTLSVVECAGKRFSLFGGGYLRLAPLSLICWGAKWLERRGYPMVIYIHPREIDPEHPRLPLPFLRRFKCYVNLAGTAAKLEHLCQGAEFCTMGQWVEQHRSGSAGKTGGSFWK